MTDKEIAEVFDRFMGTPDGWFSEKTGGQWLTPICTHGGR